MKLIKCKRIGYALLALLFALFVTAMPVSMAGDCAGDESQASSSLADWILGTDFGVVSGAIDMDNRRVMLLFSQEKLASLSMQDDEDIARRSTIYSFSIIWPKPPGHTIYDTKRKTAPRPRMNPGIPGCARAAWPLSVLHMDSSPFSVRDHGTCPIPGKPRRGISFPGEARANSPLLA